MTDLAYDVVFLDAGGVLVRPDPDLIDEELAAEGLVVDSSLHFGAHYRGVHAIDLARSAPEEFGAYHRAYASHLGLTGDDHARAVRALSGLWARTRLWTRPLPWAAAGLAAIASTGVAIVVVSNADGSVAELLAAAGLLQVGPGPGVEVSGVVDSAVVGVAKPDPAIFHLALELVGAEAHRAIHVGDAYSYDVLGARAAGVRPVLVDPLAQRGDVDCDVVASLTEVTGLLSSPPPGPPGHERPDRR